MSGQNLQNTVGFRGVALSALGIIVLTALQPYLWSLVRDRAEQLHQRWAASEQLKNLQIALQDVEISAEQRETIDEQLELVLVDIDQVSRAVERIEKAADQVQVQSSIQGIGENTVQEYGQYVSPLLISVLAVGPADKLLSYIDRLEHLPEVVVIEELLLQENESAVPGRAYTLTANIVFFSTTDLSVDAEGSTVINELGFVPNPVPASSSITLRIGILVVISSIVILGAAIRVRYLRKT